jgi:hypothetical protein
MTHRINTAIITKFIPASNTKPARVKASANDRSITISYDHALSLSNAENHAVAAQALMQKFGWTGSLVCGALEHGYVFVITDAA